MDSAALSSAGHVGAKLQTDTGRPASSPRCQSCCSAQRLSSLRPQLLLATRSRGPASSPSGRCACFLSPGQMVRGTLLQRAPGLRLGLTVAVPPTLPGPYPLTTAKPAACPFTPGWNRAQCSEIQQPSGDREDKGHTLGMWEPREEACCPAITFQPPDLLPLATRLIFPGFSLGAECFASTRVT